mgnify:CR=1 FL=1
MSDFVKQGTVKRTIKYTTKTGEEKNRYVTVGEFWSTGGGNRQAVKIYATLNSDEQWLNIYPVEDVQTKSETHEFNKQTRDVVLEDIEDKPIDLSEIPFRSDRKGL